MRILQIINSLETGGAERLITNLVPLMISCGHQVDVLIFKGKETNFKKELENLEVQVISLEAQSIYNPVLIFRLIRYLRNYDIIHVHLFPAQYWVAIASFFSFFKGKLVTTEHNTTNRRRNIPWVKGIDKFVYKRYKRIICISEQTKKFLFGHLREGERKMIVINNGIDLLRYSVCKVGATRKDILGIDNSVFLVTQVAGFRPQKDQDSLIKALKLLPRNIHVAFVGGGSRLAVCEQLVNELNLSERVHFLGIRSDIPEILAVSDIVVMSSHWEGFGLAAVEGMASGKPVIASDVEGLADVVEGGGLLFKEGEYTELAQLILELFSNKSRYIELVEAGKRKAQQFDIVKMVDSYLEIYNELLQ